MESVNNRSAGGDLAQCSTTAPTPGSGNGTSAPSAALAQRGGAITVSELVDLYMIDPILESGR
jgi:hypothetical protein